MFAKLATAIFLFSSIYILVFVGMGARVPLRYIWGVLGISAVLSLAKVLLFPERELPARQFVFRTVFYAVFCNVVVLAVGFWLNWFTLKAPVTLIGMEICFFAVLIVMYVYMYLSAKYNAAKMNEQLKKMR